MMKHFGYGENVVPENRDPDEGPIRPASYGTAEKMTVKMPSVALGKYRYYAIKAADQSGNEGLVSNIVTVFVPHRAEETKQGSVITLETGLVLGGVALLICIIVVITIVVMCRKNKTPPENTYEPNSEDAEAQINLNSMQDGSHLRRAEAEAYLDRREPFSNTSTLPVSGNNDNENHRAVQENPHVVAPVPVRTAPQRPHNHNVVPRNTPAHELNYPDEDDGENTHVYAPVPVRRTPQRPQNHNVVPPNTPTHDLNYPDEDGAFFSRDSEEPQYHDGRPIDHTYASANIARELNDLNRGTRSQDRNDRPGDRTNVTDFRGDDDDQDDNYDRNADLDQPASRNVPHNVAALPVYAQPYKANATSRNVPVARTPAFDPHRPMRNVGDLRQNFLKLQSPRVSSVDLTTLPYEPDDPRYEQATEV